MCVAKKFGGCSIRQIGDRLSLSNSVACHVTCAVAGDWSERSVSTQLADASGAAEVLQVDWSDFAAVGRCDNKFAGGHRKHTAARVVAHADTHGVAQRLGRWSLAGGLSLICVQYIIDR